MRAVRRVLSAAWSVAVIGAVSLGGPTLALAEPVNGHLVAVAPTPGTPHVLDGRVNSIARVGGLVVLGGQFTQTRNDASATVLPRANLMAFDEATSQISAGFVPVTNGPVSVVLPAPDGLSVYIGGSFTTVNGVTVKNLARVLISDGSLVTGFNPATVAGPVKDLKLAGGRLWVGGAFTHIAGKRQPALATVNPDTGAFLPFMTGAIAGTHNGGWTTVMKFDITPDGSRLVAIGNFDTFDGVKTHQAVMLDLSGATATRADWQTNFYETRCASVFDTYMRDLDISPDGRFFVISTTGAYGGSSVACDSTARFEVASSGSLLQPSWVDHTGGDTTYAVEITDSVVYTGGHARWQNNSFRGDTPGQGAVSRPGIAALDPLNGLPFSWNPTRERGVGVFDFAAIPSGLWVGSDTDRIGDYYLRSKIAHLPAGGSTFPVVREPTLPNDLYVATAGGLSKRWSTTGGFGAPTTVPGGGLVWANLKGAFMLNGFLYAAWADGSFDRRPFDGTTFGAAEAVDTHNQLIPLTDWTADIQAMTGLFYDRGRVYFTKAGSNVLFYRYFTPESKLIGARRLTASTAVAGFTPSAVRSMFLADGLLHAADTGGNLTAIGWTRNPQAGSPTGTATVLGGPAVDGVDWSAKAFFLFQDGAGDNALQPPTAQISSACTSLSCTFDAGGSSANGGTITGYAWDFGDGTTGTGGQVSKTFAATGVYPVTLTVSTAKGQIGVATVAVAVTRINQAPAAAFTQTCAGTACSFDATSSADADGSITAYHWDFGDGATGTGVAPAHEFTTEGTYAVTLSVTDNDGSTQSSTAAVAVTSAALQFVGSATTNGNRLTHSVTVPASVQPGDVLVVVASVNSSIAAPTAPAGWTPVVTRDAGGLVATAYWKTATSADPGSAFVFTTSTYVKSDLTVAAYRMSDGAAASVAAATSAVQTSSATSLTTPQVASPSAGSWLVSYWSVKSSTALTISPPTGQVTRGGGTGTGSGAVTALFTDTGVATGSGNKGGLTASVSVAVSRGAMISLIVAPN